MFKLKKEPKGKTYCGVYVEAGQWTGLDNHERPIICKGEVENGNLLYSLLDKGVWQSAYVPGNSDWLPIDMQQYVYHRIQQQKIAMKRQKNLYTPMGRIINSLKLS